MRELDQTPRASDAPASASPFKTRGFSSAADKKAAARAADALLDQEGAPKKAWYSGGGLRRRLYKKDRPDEGLDAAFAALAADRAAERPKGRLVSKVALGMGIAVAAAGIATFVLARPAPVDFHAPLPTAGSDIFQYLRGLSAWHEVSKDEVLQTQAWPSAEVSPEECAESALPAVQALCAAQRAAAANADSYTPFPKFGGIDDPLASLDLDCSSAADAAACRYAAASNSYEGEMAIDPALLAAFATPIPAAAPAPVELGPDLVSLDTLSLDCTAHPAACAKVARTTNSYEGDSMTAAPPEFTRALREQADAAAAAAAAAEAASDLSSLDLDCSKAGEDADVAAACAVAMAANSYEGRQEHSLEALRHAEQAGVADNLPVGALNVDCSSGGAVAQAECARAAASNVYETEAHNFDPENESAMAEYAANAARAYANAAKVDGYEARAQEWDPIAAQAAAKHSKRTAGLKLGPHRSSCGCTDHHHDDDLEEHATEHATPGEAHGHAHPHLHMRPLAFDAAGDVAPEALDEGAPMETATPHLPLAQQRECYEDALRTPGHDAPAVAGPADGPAAGAAAGAPAHNAAAPAAAAAAAPAARQAAGANAERAYYKNALNAPRTYYKNAANDAANRVYYKNPANAPLGYQGLPAAPAQPQTGTTWSLAQVLLSAVVALASTAFIASQLRARRAAPAHAAAEQTVDGADTERIPSAPGILAVPESIPDHVDSPRGVAYDSPRLALKHSGGFAGIAPPERPSSALDDSMLDSPRRNRTPVPGGRDSPIRHLDSPRRARTPGLRPSHHMK